MPGQNNQPATQPANKVIRVSDLETLIGAYSQIDNTGTFGKWIADAELNAIGKNGKGQGLYTDGHLPTPDHLYVDSNFIRNGLNTVNASATPAQRTYLAQVNAAINDAINGSPDHSAEVTQGKLKPLVKPSTPAPK
jgi:hypothetical protein